MHEARMIRSPLKAATYETLIGLLSVTGMRIGEAVALDRADVELVEHRLTVRHAKNGRSREVALHPSTVTALDAYARVRDELCPRPKDPSFLLTNTGARLNKGTIWHEFDRLRRATGLDRETLGRHARIHDIRHSFVLRTLLGWYRDEPTSTRSYRCSPRSSGIFTPRIPTGTSRARPSCWRSPPNGSSRPGSSTHDPAAAAACKGSSPSVSPASATPARTRSRPTATASGCCWRSCTSGPGSRHRSSSLRISTPR